jgi:TonB family protein
VKHLRILLALANTAVICLAFTSCFFVLAPYALAQSSTPEIAQLPTESVSFGSAVAANNLIKKKEPVYPPIAKTARIQGTVVLKIVISEGGAVTGVDYVSGPPLLIRAAMDAVKQWQYKPFTLNGKDVQASTTVDVVFSLGIPDAQYKAEIENNRKYFQLQGECRERIKENDGAAAIAMCKGALDAVEKLPPESQIERATAWTNYGRALAVALRIPDALAAYQQALTIASSKFHPDDADLGYAYFHVADAQHLLGQLQEAQSNFELAVSTLERARARKGATDFEINEYSVSLEHILQSYIPILQQTGQTDKARKMQEKAKTVSTEIHPCPESGDNYCSPYR